MTTYNFTNFTDEKIANAIRDLEKSPAAAKEVEAKSPGFLDALRTEVQRRKQAAAQAAMQVADIAAAAQHQKIAEQYRQQQLAQDLKVRAGVLAKRLFVGLVCFALLPTVAIIGTWSCVQEGFTSGPRTAVTILIVALTVLAGIIFGSSFSKEDWRILCDDSIKI